MSNEQMKRENDALKTENDSLKTESEVIKEEIKQLKTDNDKHKDEIGWLTALLDKEAVNNEKQLQHINSLGSEITQLKSKNQQLKVSIARSHKILY